MAAAEASPEFWPAMEDLLPGRLEDTPLGPAFVVETVFLLDLAVAGVPLGAFLEAPLDLLAGACAAAGAGPPPPGLSPDQAVFLDTETTGLAGGTGTLAFLIGVGRFEPAGPEPSAFVLRQYFVRDYPEEPAVLSLLARDWPAGRPLVTFNGVRFDWPLLETRYTLSRLRPPAPGPHLDLLRPARRLWRERLGSCALSHLEAALLGVKREEDVPSWLIPSLYFEYLRRRDASTMPLVFAHNRQDILTMVALGAVIGRLLSAPLHSGLGAAELLGLARTFLGLGRGEEALSCFEAALGASPGPRLPLPGAGEGGGPAPPRPEVRIVEEFGWALKRLGRWAEAVALWERRLALPRPELPALVELAKYLEHRAKDLQAARRVVLQALELWKAGRLACAPRDSGTGAALRHRLDRLERKLGRRPAGEPAPAGAGTAGFAPQA